MQVEGIENSIFYKIKNQMSFREIGTLNDLNPWTLVNSGARNYMFPNMVAQTPVFSGTTPKRVITGVEGVYGKGTIKVAMPIKGRVTHIIRKFGNSGLNNTAIVDENPLSHIVYMDPDRMMESNEKVLDLLELPAFCQKHPDFGFRFDYIDHGIEVGTTIPEGTVIAKSPNWHPELDQYNISVKTYVCNVSFPGVTEDGYMVAQEWIDKLETSIMGNRRFGCGKNSYLLPIHGTEKNPKVIPDIGEHVDETGLLVATRQYDELLAPIDMLNRNMRRVDPNYDDPVYIPPNAKVTDIDIYRGNDKDIIYQGGADQLEKYYNSTKLYYEQLVDIERHAIKNRYQIGVALNNAITHARLWLGNYSARGIRSWRGTPILPWELNVKYEKRQKLTIGSKVTGQHGNKGVICGILPREKMPQNIYGQYADMAMDGDSNAKRMNVGAAFEPYTTGYLDQTKRMCKQYLAEGNVDAAVNYYSEIISRLSKTHGDMLKECPDIEHEMNMFLRDGDHEELLLPPTDDHIGFIGIELAKEFDPLRYGPVRYIDEQGNKHVTLDPVLISSIDVYVVEKLGHDYSAVSTAKRQHFGLLAKPGAASRYASPVREKPNKFIGEAEGRLINYVAGPEITGRIINRPSDPIATQSLIETIVTAEQPTNIEQAIDYSVVKPNGNRARQLMSNIHYCDGLVFKRDPVGEFDGSSVVTLAKNLQE
tara:strand:- start:153551 stop:155665 length:2115 start_codon:yes stop_codon:yes gene_type:complete